MQLVNVNHGHYLHFIDEGVGGSAIWPRSADRKWGELGFEPSNVASCSFVSLVLGSSGVGEGSSAEGLAHHLGIVSLGESGIS